MKKIFINTILLFIIFLLIDCSSSTENMNVGVKLSKDTAFVKSTENHSSAEISNKSEITCPECGYKKMEVLPTDICLIKYTCKKCNTTLYPKEGDCCVFCTYGSHKCPSKQEN